MRAQRCSVQTRTQAAQAASFAQRSSHLHPRPDGSAGCYWHGCERRAATRLRDAAVLARRDGGCFRRACTVHETVIVLPPPRPPPSPSGKRSNRGEEWVPAKLLSRRWLDVPGGNLKSSPGASAYRRFVLLRTSQVSAAAVGSSSRPSSSTKPGIPGAGWPRMVCFFEVLGVDAWTDCSVVSTSAGAGGPGLF